MTDSQDPNGVYRALLAEIGAGVPDAAQFQRMAALVLDFPQAAALSGMDPLQPGYRQAAMDLYLSIRGRAEDGYVAARDEATATAIPENPWRDLPPWSFRDAGLVAEHVLSWGHMLKHMGLKPGGAVLEYGPGSGQILLMLARLGYRACGVDIDAVALDGIQRQARHLNLTVETEQGAFGEGFAGERFDAILFYEAFHHAFDAEALLLRLRERVRPGGRLVLCGEPVVAAPNPTVPYPWGPRLDALSVFCMQRFGWMELGFTQDFLFRLAAATGWQATVHPFAGCGRAGVFVLELGAGKANSAAASHSANGRVAAAAGPEDAFSGGFSDDPQQARIASLQAESRRQADDIGALRRQVAAYERSTSWRVTAPLRWLKERSASARQGSS